MGSTGHRFCGEAAKGRRSTASASRETLTSRVDQSRSPCLATTERGSRERRVGIRDPPRSGGRAIPYYRTTLRREAQARNRPERAHRRERDPGRKTARWSIPWQGINAVSVVPNGLASHVPRS